MDIAPVIALSLGAAWASGLNLYAAVFMLGFLGSGGYITLPPNLLILSDPLILGAAAIMYCIEFFADKVPGVDTGWDVLHSFIRIPAGAALAAGAVGELDPVVQIAAGLVGAGVAATSHSIKAGSRVMINTSPEPLSNWTASVAEDLAVFAGLWTALNHPWVFLGLFGLFVLLAIWLLPRLWRGIRRVFGWLFGRRDASRAANDTSSPPELQLPNLIKNRDKS